MIDNVINGAKRTLVDAWLAQQEGIPLAKPICPCCQYERWPIEMIDTRDLPDEPDSVPFVCSHCVAGRVRLTSLQTERVSEDELWNDIKGRRNLLLEQHAWTVRADSPLTATCKAEFLIFMQTLHKITVDYATPGEVHFPQVPNLVYEG